MTPKHVQRMRRVQGNVLCPVCGKSISRKRHYRAQGITRYYPCYCTNQDDRYRVLSAVATKQQGKIDIIIGGLKGCYNGQPVYVPYFHLYRKAEDVSIAQDDSTIHVYIVDDEARRLFPELGDKKVVRLRQHGTAVGEM